jgi:hypothetical protein
MAKPAELPEKQRRALSDLKPLSERLGLYLAGGTALAFHLGHRVSHDLDLFSLRSDLDLKSARAGAVELEDVEVLSLTDATLRFRASGVPVNIVRYAYPLLNAACEGPQGVATASVEDLATMKLSAAAQRGIRRDFWDLEEIFDKGGLSLERALQSYVRRFGVQESDVYHVLRSLSYFDDAEKETIMPDGLTAAKWPAIKASMSKRAAAALESMA